MGGTTLKNGITSLYLIFSMVTIGFTGILVFEGITNKGGVSATSIIVDSNGQGDYIKIQDAIDNATSGTIIYVWDGIYFENLLINKSLTLIGNGTQNTIINGSGINDVIYISANWVNISEFSITGSGSGPLPYNYHAGIELNNVNNITIEKNKFSYNDLGIYSYNSEFIFIMDNNCSNNNKVGIHINFCENIEITNNYCDSNSWVGICLDNTKLSRILNNYCSQNGNVGIHFDLHSNLNIIRNNTCENNTVGFKFFKCNNNTFFKNNILNNDQGGLWLQYGSKDNYLFHNNFILNINQVYDSNIGNNFFNNGILEGNYWSDYGGNDTGNMSYIWDLTGKHLIAGDGIGDTEIPHYNLDYYPLIKPYLNESPIIIKLIDPGEVDSDGNYIIKWYPYIGTFNYILQEDKKNNFIAPKTIYDGSNSIFQIKNRNNGTYYYRVRAYNLSFMSDWSNIVNITVDWFPDIPRNLKVSTYPPGNVLNLSWDLNLIDTKEYCIEYKNDTIYKWTLIKNFSHPINYFNHTELQNGEKYYYRIRAKDFRNQLSNFSEIIQNIPWDSLPPAPPRGLKVISTTNNTISLAWKPNSEKDVEGYRIYRSRTINPIDWGEPIINITKGIEEYIDSGLDEQTTYYYVIIAFDEVPNNSSYSNIVYGTTISGPYGPEINYSLKDFEILEDTIDDSTIKLYDWFKDKNNDPLVFWVEGNENISVYIYQNNGTVSLIPAKNWNGKETLIFYASDGFSNISDVINVTVTPVNDPPGPVVIIEPKDGFEVYNGTTINFLATCSDPDLIYGDKLTFEWSSNLSGKFGNGKNLTNIFLHFGNHQITLKVTDLVGEFSSDMINITILLKTITNNTDNETPNYIRPEKPDNTNETKNDTNSGEDEGVKLKIFGIIISIAIIITIIILIWFFIVIKKKAKVEKSKEQIQSESKLGRQIIKTEGEIVPELNEESLIKNDSDNN